MSTKKFKHYIKVRGSARLKVRARSKAEAVEKARRILERRLERCPRFAQARLPVRWGQLAGFEASAADPKQREFFHFEWKNHPRQAYRKWKR